MAMIACKECGSEVSSKATTCPKCGVTLRKKTSGCAMVAAGLLALVGIFMVVGMITNDYSTPSSASTTSAKAKADDGSTEKSTRAQTLVLLIRKTLRNPDSFKAESVLVTDALSVCATYRAENGFGGMNREQAVMSADKTKALNSNERGFTALWNAECAGKTGLETKYIFPR